MDLQEFMHQMLSDNRQKEYWLDIWRDNLPHEIIEALYFELFKEKMAYDDIVLAKANKMVPITKSVSASKAQRDNEEYFKKQVSLIK